MKSKQKGFTAVTLTIVILWVVGLIGWVANIVQVVGMLSDPITGLFILKAIGIIVAPLGAVLGFMGMF